MTRATDRVRLRSRHRALAPLTAAAGGVYWAATLCGCASTGPASPPPGPPAAWVHSSTPISAAPVQYDYRMTAEPPPVFELQTPPPDFQPQTPPSDFQPSMPIGPAVPAPVM